jgi:hypothetical protein
VAGGDGDEELKSNCNRLRITVSDNNCFNFTVSDSLDVALSVASPSQAECLSRSPTTVPESNSESLTTRAGLVAGIVAGATFRGKRNSETICQGGLELVPESEEGFGGSEKGT